MARSNRTAATAGSVSSRAKIILGFLASFYLFTGLLLIPYPGVENDEALFATALYEPEAVADVLPLPGRDVGLMLMNYLGALKAWIYAPVLAVFPPSVWSVRVPVLLIGAACILLLFRFLRLAAGELAAITGAVLLATDPTFLLTATFDWGPVALQHFLFLAGIGFMAKAGTQPADYALSASQRHFGLAGRVALRGMEWPMAAGAFCFGLALWDKALFAWTLSGAAVAGAICYHRDLRRLFTFRRAAIAATAFVLGASPLIAYNLAHGFPTFQGKRHSLEDLDRKLAVMRYTLEGNVMSGFLIDYGAPPDKEPAPENAVEAASLRLADATGHPTRGLLPFALLLAALAAPLAWGTPKFRLLAFFTIAFAVGWIQMLFTNEAGGSAHHTILLWPYLIGFVSVSLAGTSERWGDFGRWIAGGVAGAVGVVNAAVLNQYLAGLIVFGPGPLWTDASFALVNALERRRPPIIYTADWGMGDTLRLFLHDATTLANAIEPYTRQELDAAEAGRIRERVADPAAVFVSYVDGRDAFPMAKRLVAECAAASGYRRETLEVIPDRRGRPVFEVYRFRPIPGSR